jgi:hypothetical protein
MISRIARFSIPLACAALLAAQAGAQITSQKGGYQFRLRLVKGATMNYSVEYTVSSPTLPSGSVTVTSPMRIAIGDVVGGAASISESMGPVTMNGKSQPARNVVVKVNSLGKAVAGQEPGMQGATLAMPEKPVRVGGSWAASIPLNAGGANAKQVAVRYKLVRVGMVAGRKVAVLNVAVTGGATGSGTALLSVADGFLVSTNMSIKLTVPDNKGGQAAVTAVAKVTRK